jgi:hypothetical protein
MGRLVSMNQKRRRKRRYLSEEEKERAVRRYEESGLSQLEFCRCEGIGLSSLRRWVESKRGKRAEKEVRFVEVETQTPSVEKTREYRIGNPRGMWIEFGSGFDGVEVLALANILREGERC